MIRKEEVIKFFEDADSRRRELGEYRMMVQRAHGILREINSSDKSIPVWLQNALIRLGESLTLEPRDL